MSDELNPCTECGMPCSVGEYHPYAACLMFKACHNSETVRENLDFVRNTRPDTNPYKYAEHSDWWAVFGKIFDFDKEEEERSRALFNAARELKEKP